MNNIQKTILSLGLAGVLSTGVHDTWNYCFQKNSFLDRVNETICEIQDPEYISREISLWKQQGEFKLGNVSVDDAVRDIAKSDLEERKDDRRRCLKEKYVFYRIGAISRNIVDYVLEVSK